MVQSPLHQNRPISWDTSNRKKGGIKARVLAKGSGLGMGMDEIERKQWTENHLIYIGEDTQQICVDVNWLNDSFAGRDHGYHHLLIFGHFCAVRDCLLIRNCALSALKNLDCGCCSITHLQCFLL